MISFALVERQSQLCLFEFLYRTYSQGMFQIAYGILHDVQHAEDMVAEGVRNTQTERQVQDLRILGAEECIVRCIPLMSSSMRLRLFS